MKKNSLVSFTFFALFIAKSFAQDYKLVHVFVALCDNKNQGIVPVPAKIGNGQDPVNNLYWGCGYGVKTIFKNHMDWKLLRTIKSPSPDILERLVFIHKTKAVYLIADAWDGSTIKKTTETFLKAASGNLNEEIIIDSIKLNTKNANVIAYLGHNGLMDFELNNYPLKKDERKREVIIIACASKQYFTPAIKSSGAYPLVWSTHLMSAEAYTFEAALQGWLLQETYEQIRKRAAIAYNKYQKCGERAAMNLIVTGF